MPSKELYIGNIDPNTKPQEIKDLFEQYGNVNRCEVKFGGSGKIKRINIIYLIKLIFSVFCSIRFCWI
jgi:RNA recognition motif-containing protein